LAEAFACPEPRIALNIPDKVRAVALTRSEAGQSWLDALPAQAAEIVDRWRIEIGDSPPNASEAFVAFGLLQQIVAEAPARVSLAMADAWAGRATLD
jgi:hypothetical protein